MFSVFVIKLDFILPCSEASKIQDEGLFPEKFSNYKWLFLKMSAAMKILILDKNY